MGTNIRLITLRQQTSFAPLGVLGYCLTRTNFLAPVFAGIELLVKKEVDHSVPDKLQDILVSILAGCRSIAQVNTRIRPDLVLARAWQRECFAEQSNLARTLDAFSKTQLQQLRSGSETLFRRESRTLRHPFQTDWLWLDLDFTPLPISKHAEGSTRGKIDGKKNRYGRQLARVHAPQYHETLFSHLYPGKQPNNPAYIPTMKELDAFLDLSLEAKKRTIIRTDAGFGSDQNVDYALDEDWQFTGKGFSGTRATKLAAKIPESAWEDLGHQRWVAKPATHPTYVRPVQYLLLRWITTTGLTKYASIICSIFDWSPIEVIHQYDDRGSCETEIQADKGGLKMSRRRKHHLDAQEALILLTDLAHNLVAWNSSCMFPEGPLSRFGTTRLIEDVFAINGRLIFKQEQLAEVQLNKNHPYAEAVAQGLRRLLDHFGL